MFQTFPHHSLLVEDLRYLSATQMGKTVGQRTFSALAGPSLMYARTRLAQTFDLSRVPSYTSPQLPEVTGWLLVIRREDESICDVGSIVLEPHMCLSSRRHFRKAELEGSRVLRASGTRLSGGKEAGHDM